MSADPDGSGPRRFRSAASHYLAGRPAYSPRLIDRIVLLCGLQPADRVLDLGCGPGQLAVAFAPFVAEVLGLDPEPEMLRIARSGAPANVTFSEGSSETIGPELGRFRLVTMGRSFHWMDRVETIRRLDAMIEPDGAIVLFGDTHPELAENGWQTEFRCLVQRYADDDATRIRRDSPEWRTHTAILLQSRFHVLERISIIERRTLSTDRLIDRALSMSSTSRARLGDRADLLTAELRTLLQRLAPSGELAEVVTTIATIARRALQAEESRQGLCP